MLIHFDRLLTLADFLDTVPEEQFCFAMWVDDNYNGRPLRGCGTTACAMGWATQIPEFQALGLALVDLARPYRPNMFEPAILGTDKAGMATITNRGLAAARFLFGLTHAQACRLFMPHDDEYDDDENSLSEEATAKQVAEHIRRFVREERGW
jgi:hypothetical protein